MKKWKYFVLIVIIVSSFSLGYLVSKYLNYRYNLKLSSYLAVSGALEMVDKDYINSLKDLFASIYFDSNNSLAHHGLGVFFYDAGLNDLALVELNNYLKNPGKNPNLIDKFIPKSLKDKSYIDIGMAHMFLADIYGNKGNAEMRIKELRKALDIFPDLQKFLQATIKFISEKKDKDENDIRRLKRYSKFCEDLKPFSEEGHRGQEKP